MPDTAVIIGVLLVIVIIVVVAYFALRTPDTDAAVGLPPTDASADTPANGEVVIPSGETIVVPPPATPPAGNMSPAADAPSPPPPPPPPALSKYIVSSGVDLTPGKNLWVLHSTTPEKCAVKCDSDSACVGFSSKGTSCWGKNSRSGVSDSGVTAYTTSSGAVVQVVAPPPAPTAPQWRSKARQDITPGVNMWVLSGNVDACKAKCGPDPNCKAFTINATNSRCWGKASSQYSDRATNATAWVKY